MYIDHHISFFSIGAFDFETIFPLFYILLMTCFSQYYLFLEQRYLMTAILAPESLNIDKGLQYVLLTCYITYNFLWNFATYEEPAWSQTNKDNGTICPRSCNPFYIITYYIKWVTISCTHSII